MSEPSGIPELIEQYAVYLRALNRVPRTVTAYTVWLRRFFAFAKAHGVAHVADVTHALIREYQRHESQLINHKGHISTVVVQNQHLGCVCWFFKFLHVEGYIAHNPAQHLELARAPRRLPRAILSPAEMKKLLRQPNVNTLLGYRDRAIMEVLYSTGIRRQELLNLTVEDVDLEAGVIYVRQGKGGKDRVVPLGRVAARFVETYINGLREMFLNMRLADNRLDTRRLFLSRRGTPLGEVSLTKRIDIHARAAGLSQKVTPHLFRHTCATHMVRNRANLRHVQEMLGHLHLNTTEQYLHLTITDLKEAHHKFHPREKDA